MADNTVAPAPIKPAYLVAKIGAILVGLSAFWTAGFDIHSAAGQAGIATMVTALGSIVENNATANKIFGFVTTVLNFLGINTTPQPPTV